MQFRQLEIFLAVAKRNSFSKAAETLYLSQPTVSAHVRALEDELGAKLFLRSTKGLSLTPQGQLFFTYADEIVSCTRRAKAELREISDDQTQSLMISASTVPAQCLLPSVLTEVYKRFPNTFFHVLERDSAGAVQAVLSGEAELGLVGSRLETKDLIYTPFAKERLVVAAPNTPFFRSMKGTLPSDTIESQPFILREEGSGTRKTMEALLLAMKVARARMRIVGEMQSTACILNSIEHGLGISIVSSLAAGEAARAGRILLFDCPLPQAERDFYAVSRAQIPLSAAGKVLIELLCEEGSMYFQKQ